MGPHGAFAVYAGVRGHSESGDLGAVATVLECSGSGLEQADGGGGGGGRGMSVMPAGVDVHGIDVWVELEGGIGEC